MGEVTTLRLELCRERDRANAFEKALTTDVLKIAKVAIYQAMLDADSKAADTIGCMGVELDDLKAENARLKADNVRLMQENAILRTNASQDPTILRAVVEVAYQRMMDQCK